MKTEKAYIGDNKRCPKCNAPSTARQDGTPFGAPAGSRIEYCGRCAYAFEPAPALEETVSKEEL